MTDKNTEKLTETMLDAMNSVQEVSLGDTVRGEVLVLEDGKQAIVGILGTGVEGVVPLKELSTVPVDDISEVVAVGDILDLVVIASIGKDKENGSYLLSKRRLDAKKIWEEIEQKFESGEFVEATVKDSVRGGLVVEMGVRGFVPASMVEDHFVEDFSGYKGQTLLFKIIEIEPSENRLILSRKAVLNETKEAAKKELMNELTVGQVTVGKVARLTNFGAFVNLGSIDGLVHISEISHTHISNPSEVLTVGDDVEVKILAINPEEDRVSLTIKGTQPGPWETIETQFPIGTVVTGKVKRLTSFGAFVEISKGIEGLVHISQISHKHIATPHEVLQEGQTVEVKVLDVQPKNRRIALSIKALESKPESEVEEVIDFELPEESTGFTLGEVLGSALSQQIEPTEEG